MFGHELLGVEMDNEGMVPDALERSAASSDARVVFLQPTIHNPTARIMSEQRRRDIIAVARKRDLLLVEDDVYGLFPPERPPAIAALAPERTVYVSSASKSIAPGLRVGWMVAPERHVQLLGDTRYGLSGPLPALTFEVARRWIEDGTASQLMLGMRNETIARQQLVADRLRGLTFEGNPAAFHILLHLPEHWRREDFVAAASARGVKIVPVSSFVVGQDVAPHAVRISVAAAPDRDALARALDTIEALASMQKTAAAREVV
jgi:DNA-binding transcriptional MocR family regulator